MTDRAVREKLRAVAKEGRIIVRPLYPHRDFLISIHALCLLPRF